MKTNNRLFAHKGTLLVGLLCSTLCIGFAQAETTLQKSATLTITNSLNRQNSVTNISSKINNPEHLLGSAHSISDQALAEVSGKGIPSDLPSVSHNSNSVVLWDELQTGKGGGKPSIELGSPSNLQSISMLANK